MQLRNEELTCYQCTMVQMIDLEDAVNIDQVQLCRVIIRIARCIQHVGGTAESINTPPRSYTL